MKTTSIALIAFAMSLFAGTAAAAGTKGIVKRIYPSGSVHTNNRVRFRLENDSCNTSSTGYYYIDLASPQGEAQYRLLLSAALAGKPLNVSVDACNFSGDKLVRYIYLDR